MTAEKEPNVYNFDKDLQLHTHLFCNLVTVLDFYQIPTLGHLDFNKMFWREKRIYSIKIPISPVVFHVF